MRAHFSTSFQCAGQHAARPPAENFYFRSCSCRFAEGLKNSENCSRKGAAGLCASTIELRRMSKGDPAPCPPTAQPSNGRARCASPTLRNLVQEFRLCQCLPDLRATVGAFIDEVDLRHAPMRCDVPDVHRQAHTVWADHEGRFGVVMADIAPGMSAPQQGIQQSSPTRRPAYASAAATMMVSSEHRGNDRAFPACVTNLHDAANSP